MRLLLGRVFAVVLLGFSVSVQAADGMVTVKSEHGVEATADKLESVLKDRGMTVMARINHQQGAEKAGL